MKNLIDLNNKFPGPGVIPQIFNGRFFGKDYVFSYGLAYDPDAYYCRLKRNNKFTRLSGPFETVFDCSEFLIDNYQNEEN